MTEEMKDTLEQETAEPTVDEAAEAVEETVEVAPISALILIRKE